jgi:hypothetical protein
MTKKKTVIDPKLIQPNQPNQPNQPDGDDSGSEGDDVGEHLVKQLPKRKSNANPKAVETSIETQIETQELACIEPIIEESSNRHDYKGDFANLLEIMRTTSCQILRRSRSSSKKLLRQ